MGYKEDQRLPSERDPEAGEASPPPPYRPYRPPGKPGPSEQPFPTLVELPAEVPDAPTELPAEVPAGPVAGGLSAQPPPLPPRRPVNHPKQEEFIAKLYARPTTLSWIEQDPRSRSTESLVPREHRDDKRVLLMIYIHGFVGDETSFRSFPAHVHNLATELLSNTHEVHTKIYPKYKSRRNISYARDDFSKWLIPHESPNTDVILIGHSMGGMLASDVVLIPAAASAGQFHRILGTINFDTPFLGMHPGVIKAGLGSLFKPSSPTPKFKSESIQSADGVYRPTSSANTESQVSLSPSVDSSAPSTAPSTASYSTPVNDPNFNPRFSNDVTMPVRKGWDNALHFLNKHSDHLTSAAKTYVTSHLEFGSAMGDYKALFSRYKDIRSLEDVDDSRGTPTSSSTKRVRFVNYYTASTGKLKPPPPSAVRGREFSPRPYNAEQGMSQLSVASADQRSRSRSKSPAPSGSQAPRDDVSELTRSIHSADISARPSLERVSPEPLSVLGEDDKGHGPSVQNTSETNETGNVVSSIEESQLVHDLPDLPPEPTEPEPFNPDSYNDADARKLAEKDYKRKVKVYNQALKDREKAVRDRNKIVEKREKALRKEQEKALKHENKRLQKVEPGSGKSEYSASQKSESLYGPDSTSQLTPSISSQSYETSGDSADEIQTADLMSEDRARAVNLAPEKKKKDKKFCMLPKKSTDGQRDTTWVRVPMEGLDEVGAHMGLFYTENRHYEKLVSDVGHLVLEWVERDIAMREARERRP